MPTNNEVEIQAQLVRVRQFPASDSERLVFADMLTEAGDAHGEFIVLQLLSESTPGQKRRIKSLQKSHGKEFAGSLDALIKPNGRIFTRGFLSECTIKHGNVLSALAQDSNAAMLKVLNIGKTPILGLEPLCTLLNLEGLNLARTKGITSLAPLGMLTNLRSLTLTRTADPDLSPLSTLQNLEVLDLRWKRIADLTPIGELAGLRELYLKGTHADPLKLFAGDGLQELQTLDLDDTPIVDLQPLAALPALETLSLIGTEVTDITPLAKVSGLQSLDLTNTLVASVSALAGLRELTVLNVGSTQVVDFDPLCELSALRTLLVNAETSPGQLANLRAAHPALDIQLDDRRVWRPRH